MGRSIPNSRKAEKDYPVRVRVAVPPGGFGWQLNAIRDWLDAQVGRGAWRIWSDATPDLPDAVLFYFLDVRQAAAFVDRFACGLAVLPLDERPS